MLLLADRSKDYLFRYLSFKCFVGLIGESGSQKHFFKHPH